MKTALTFLLFLLPMIDLLMPLDKAVLTIAVMDESGHALPGTEVQIFREGRQVTAVITDLKGGAEVTLEKGTYDVEVTYPGYRTYRQEGIMIKEDVTLKVYLAALGSLDEVMVTGLAKPKARKTLPFDGVSPVSDRGMVPSAEMADIPVRGQARISESPAAGQITAGEWNDLYNWKDWMRLLDEEGYRTMEVYWKISARHRYSVLVLNERKQPLSGASVQLLGKDGQLIWEGISDLSGRVELWDATFGDGLQARRIEVKYGDHREVLRTLTAIDRGSNIVSFPVDCQDEISLDIALVVDATGSMSDEISYLQSELQDVIERVEGNTGSISWSSVFYRDQGEDFVVSARDFTAAGPVIDFIKEQGAKGGGDFPEAVSEALQAAVTDLSWDPDSDVKLLFLLLDAPPHGDPASMHLYREQIRKAAAKGIKIIPITASGIDRETEFLMKFTALLTNGTYVFITDDSGIGDPHLDPVVKDFEVEKLNDLLVRLINSYAARPECREETEVLLVMDHQIYPNPARDFINVSGMVDGDIVLLISASGKIVKRVEVSDSGIHQLSVADLISGTYLLRIQRGKDAMDKRVMVIR